MELSWRLKNPIQAFGSAWSTARRPGLLVVEDFGLVADVLEDDSVGSSLSSLVGAVLSEVFICVEDESLVRAFVDDDLVASSVEESTEKLLFSSGITSKTC